MAKEYHNIYMIAIFPPFTTIVIVSLICLFTLEAYIANNMNPDQTVPKRAV